MRRGRQQGNFDLLTKASVRGELSRYRSTFDERSTIDMDFQRLMHDSYAFDARIIHESRR